MTPLILGASGQVGQALVLECQRRKWRWTGTYHEHPIGDGLLKADLSDPEGVRALVLAQKPSVVFMPSGFTWVDGCEDQPERARTINALAPEAVAQACKQLGAALVFYSTDYVFGEHGGPYDEKAPTNPLGVYGASKLEGEQRVLAACPDALVLRTCVVYGPEPQGKNAVYQIVKNLLAGKVVVQPSDQLASPTYNRDLAKASVELVELMEKGVWNVSGAETLDRGAFARLVAANFGLDQAKVQPKTTAEMQQKAKRPLSAGFQIEKLVKRLGWKPKGPVEGLQAMKAELEANGQWVQLKAGAA
jgi:dTDP-4-dehydrorhamnose reductase